MSKSSNVTHCHYQLCRKTNFTCPSFFQISYSMKFQSLFAASSCVANVTIVCADGNLASHKIVVAGVSTFIKNILADFPIGDDVTIMLPDFTLSEVEVFLKTVCSSVEELRHFGLSTAFGSYIQYPIKVNISKEECRSPYFTKREDGEKNLRIKKEENYPESQKIDVMETKCSDEQKYVKADANSGCACLNFDVEKNFRKLEDEVEVLKTTLKSKTRKPTRKNSKNKVVSLDKNQLPITKYLHIKSRYFKNVNSSTNRKEEIDPLERPKTLCEKLMELRRAHLKDLKIIL